MKTSTFCKIVRPTLSNGREQSSTIVARVELDGDTYQITTRFRHDISTADKIIYRDIPLEIVSVADRDGRQRFLTITARPAGGK